MIAGLGIAAAMCTLLGNVRMGCVVGWSPPGACRLQAAVRAQCAHAAAVLVCAACARWLRCCCPLRMGLGSWSALGMHPSAVHEAGLTQHDPRAHPPTHTALASLAPPTGRCAAAGGLCGGPHAPDAVCAPQGAGAEQEGACARVDVCSGALKFRAAQANGSTPMFVSLIGCRTCTSGSATCPIFAWGARGARGTPCSAIWSMDGLYLTIYNALVGRGCLPLH